MGAMANLVISPTMRIESTLGFSLEHSGDNYYRDDWGNEEEQKVVCKHVMSDVRVYETSRLAGGRGILEGQVCKFELADLASVGRDYYRVRVLVWEEAGEA